MSEDSHEKTGSEFLLGAWIQAIQEFWSSVTAGWQSTGDSSQTSTGSTKGAESRSQELWFSTMKFWQAMLSTLSEPTSMEAMSRGITALPQIALKMSQTGWDGYFHLHRMWMEKIGKLGDKAETFQFDNLDQEAFKSWLEIYEKEFKQFFTLPQLGLTRFHQERFNRTLDKLNVFHIAGAEFLYLLYLPVEKSLRFIGDKLQELSKDGQLSEDFKEYYNMWIKTLEGHYMTLFKSPDYTLTLSKALNAMEDFILAEQELLSNVLKALPVPTNEEMDELYKELYLVKKRLRQIEKKKDR